MKGKILLYGGVFGILFFGAMLGSPFWQLPLLMVMISLEVAVSGYRMIDVQKFIKEGGNEVETALCDRIRRNREATFDNWIRS